MNSRDERSVADLGLYINDASLFKYYNIHLFFDEHKHVRLVWVNGNGEIYFDDTSGIVGKKWNF